MVAAIVGIAFVGYFVGVEPSDPHRDTDLRSSAVTATDGDVADAVTYEDLRTTDIGPNRGFVNELGKLRSVADVPAPTSPPDPQAKRASLAARDSLRAYNGAPPVIPHAVDARDATSCLACHGDGLRVGDRIAAKIPHESFASCTQCHVEKVSSMPLTDLVPFIEGEGADDGLLAKSAFSGKPAPFEGSRAWLGAPPVIPHSTWMRNDCLSCHGDLGKPGLRSSHPERTVCLQCHAQSSSSDRFANRYPSKTISDHE